MLLGVSSLPDSRLTVCPDPTPEIPCSQATSSHHHLTPSTNDEGAKVPSHFGNRDNQVDGFDWFAERMAY